MARPPQREGRAQYWVPLAAIVTADSAAEAHAVVSELVAARRRLHPAHPVTIVVDSADQVRAYKDATP